MHIVGSNNYRDFEIIDREKKRLGDHNQVHKNLVSIGNR